MNSLHPLRWQIILTFPRIRCAVFLALMIFAALALGARDAAAQPNTPQKLLGTFGSWQALSFRESDQPVCYMVETLHFPKSKKNKAHSFTRGDARLMITHRPAENSTDVLSYIAGYNFKPVSDVKIHVGQSTFELFTAKDTAWARDTKTDRHLAAAIRGGGVMTITGVPVRKGIGPVTDRLDLHGAAEAYRAISKACGVELEAPAKPASKKPLKPLHSPPKTSSHP